MQLTLPWDLDFVAIDFETAIGHHICSVGIVSVENGIVTEEYHALIKPPNNYYSPYTIAVHGITPDKTFRSPTFKELYPEIKKRLKSKIIVAHNETFDRNVLTKSMKDIGLDYSELNLSSKWECTMRIYKRKGYKPANLAACCTIHDIPLNHHDALSDAKACAELYKLCL